MAQSIAVEARHAVKEFGTGPAAVRALNDVSISIREGEFFTLLGPSGCGKTTLLRLIAGFEKPTSGQILLSGQDITVLPPNKRPVNTVFQSYALLPHLTVAKNSGFGLQMQGRPRAEVKATTERMLALVKMQAFASRKPARLSGGQQQRVALARALAPAPKVLLLDEPLSALDLKLRKEMQIELKRLQTETGITFVFVTHDQEKALTMSDRIGVMSAGRLQQMGSPKDICTTPVNRFVASFIGETNFLPATCEAGGLRLAGGQLIDGPKAATGRKVTVTVRPEQARLVAPGDPAAIPAKIRTLVHFGTDTHCHMAPADGTEVVARLQSPAIGDDGLAQGQAIGLRFVPGSVQVLEDQMTPEQQRPRTDTRRNWLLSAPALLFLTLTATLPFPGVLVYSFLTPGQYGNVEWRFSTDGWVGLILTRDVFDDTLVWADAHVIRWSGPTPMSHAGLGRRPCHDHLAHGETGRADHDHHLFHRLSHRMVHRHAPRQNPALLAVRDHHPVLDQPCDAKIHHRDLDRAAKAGCAALAGVASRGASPPHPPGYLCRNERGENAPV